MPSNQAKCLFSLEPLRTGAGEQHFFRLFLVMGPTSGKVTPARFKDVTRKLVGASFLAAREFELVDFFASLSSNHLGDGVAIDHRINGALLDELVELNALVWKNNYTVRLQRGAIRHATPQWRFLHDEKQQATFVGEPPAEIILPSVPPRYVDLQEHQLGPLKIELDDTVAYQWLRLPLATKENIHSIRKALFPLTTRYRLPLPELSPHKVISQAKVEPILSCSDLSLHISSSPREGALGSYELEIKARAGDKVFSILPLLHDLTLKGSAKTFRKLLQGSVLELTTSQNERLVLDEKTKNLLLSLLQMIHLAPQSSKRTSTLSAEEALCILLLPEISSHLAEAPPELKTIPKWKEVEILLPSSFLGELREYQYEGVQWLKLLGSFGLGGILADEMGLGKTVQVLAYLAQENARDSLGRSLIICPKSVLPNWVAEINRFLPTIPSSPVKEKLDKELLEEDSACKIILTTYPRLLRDFELLENYHFDYIILDESQYIKNRNTALSKIACRLQGRRKLCLSGTPLENSLSDLWAQFRFLMPQLLGSYEAFDKRFRRPIEEMNDDFAKSIFQARTSPFILRRTKAMVVEDLPELNEITQLIDLSPSQQTAYKMVAASALDEYRQQRDKDGIRAARHFALRTLVKMRQICCDLRLLQMESLPTDSAKLQMLLEMLELLRAKGRRALVFSQFTSMLNLIEEELERLSLDFVRLDGSTRDRTAPVLKFQQGEADVFLISLRAGGTGLNLTSADQVIHYDPWWNPAVTDQATARAHRIGQKNPVFVYHFISAGTVEERIRALQQRKADLAADLVPENHNKFSRLSEGDIEYLLEEPE